MAVLNGIEYAEAGWSTPAELWPAAVTQRRPKWRSPEPTTEDDTVSEQVRHTPEPWYCDQRNWRGQETPRDWYIHGDRREVEEEEEDGDDEGQTVVLTTSVAMLQGNATDGGITEATARRIVACVNAMEGIADPSAVPELLAACEALPLDCEFEDAADFKDRSGQFRRAMDLARSAIRKATGTG